MSQCLDLTYRRKRVFFKKTKSKNEQDALVFKHDFSGKRGFTIILHLESAILLIKHDHQQMKWIVTVRDGSFDRGHLFVHRIKDFCDKWPEFNDKKAIFRLMPRKSYRKLVCLKVEVNEESFPTRFIIEWQSFPTTEGPKKDHRGAALPCFSEMVKAKKEITQQLPIICKASQNVNVVFSFFFTKNSKHKLL